MAEQTREEFIKDIRHDLGRGEELTHLQACKLLDAYDYLLTLQADIRFWQLTPTERIDKDELIKALMVDNSKKAQEIALLKGEDGSYYAKFKGAEAELNALTAQVLAIPPLGAIYSANCSQSDTKRVLHVWPSEGGESYDIEVPRTDAPNIQVTHLALHDKPGPGRYPITKIHEASSDIETMDNTGKRFQVKVGWDGAGRFGTIIGPSYYKDQFWVPVLFDDQEDLDWYKASSLALMPDKPKEASNDKR